MSKVNYFHPALGLAQVKRGFCWPAFFFGSLWALARRMYLLTVILLVLEIVLWFVTGFTASHHLDAFTLLALLLNLVYAFVRGKYGNRWIAALLVRKGYVANAAQN